MRRRLIAIAIVVAFVVAASTFRGGGGVFILGDLASDLRAGLSESSEQVTWATSEGEARVTIIAVTDWDKLDFVPGARPICRDLCRAGSGLALVRVRRVTIFGLRTTVFINISGFLDPAQTTRFALSEQGKACLSVGLAGEIGGQEQGPWPENCLSADQIGTGWRFDFF